MSRVILIGLDSAPPELVFEKFVDELPNIKNFLKHGIYSRLESIFPPITIPAWLCMATGKNPGELGLYGFRHRKGFSYTEFKIPTADKIKARAIWHILGEHGKSSCLVSVPPSYPPMKINGYVISCFLTPSAKTEYTYPKELKKEIEDLVGEYIFDVVFRTEERDKVLEKIYEMTQKRFKVIKYLIENKKFDFLMSVEIGLDRIHHAFWKYFDEEHHLHEPNSKYKNVIKDYYKYLDKEIGEVLKLLGDEDYLILASDHGTKRMKGCFCINEWFIKQGYLRLNEYPENVTELNKASIDWSRSIAWGWGGYYARIFLNVKGREENGIIEQKDYEKVRNEIKEKLSNVIGRDGKKMRNIIYTPEEAYGICNGDKPDLMAIFDDLYYRSAGTIGHKKLFLDENDKGPDDAMHSMHGIFILYNKSRDFGGKEVEKMSIYDVAPTVLKLLGIKAKEEMRGKAIKEIEVV